MPIVVRARNFAAEVLQAREPVLVDFYGEQCMPCRLLRPILLELSREYEGMKFTMFNTDRELRDSDEDYEDKFAVLEAFGVMNLPTLLLFRNGELLSSIVGLHTKDELLGIFRQLGIQLRAIPHAQPVAAAAADPEPPEEEKAEQ